MIFFTKTSLYTLLVLVLLAAGIGGFVNWCVGSRPEKEMVQSFLKTNSVMIAQFGLPMEVTYVRAPASVAYHPNKTAGMYRFLMNGRNMSGTVDVYWEYTKSHGISVKSINLLHPSAERSERLWPTSGTPAPEGWMTYI